MKRAVKGGEIGPNREHYPGGSFMPEANKPKGLSQKKTSTGRQEVAPGEWQTPPEFSENTYLVSLYRAMANTELYDRQSDTFAYNDSLNEAYFPPRDERMEMIEAYNTGARWMVRDEQDRSFVCYADTDGQTVSLEPGNVPGL